MRPVVFIQLSVDISKINTAFYQPKTSPEACASVAPSQTVIYKINLKKQGASNGVF